jgi:hypothetical protein
MPAEKRAFTGIYRPDRALPAPERAGPANARDVDRGSNAGRYEEIGDLTKLLAR